MRKLWRRVVAAWVLAVFCVAARCGAQVNPAWLRPFPAFRIAGNLYYVGSEDLASYLIVTRKGNILINSNLEQSVPMIEKSVESLGFKMSDIKLLLISHAHYDHCAGSAAILKMTGAQYAVMDGDVSVVESGGRDDFQYGNDKSMAFPPAQVDRRLHDGDTVSLGGATLTAHLTAGHTKGTTTWTMNVKRGKKTLHVVIVGSPNVNPGYKLFGSVAYPQIASDYVKGFRELHELPVDIFLGAHGSYFGLIEKYHRFEHGEKDAFIDPRGYDVYIREREQAFLIEMRKQQTGKN